MLQRVGHLCLIEAGVSSHMIMPTSTLPDLVAIGTPSLVVNPIVVSTQRPSTMALMLDPAPR